MPATLPVPRWGDGSLYGDGDYYTSVQGIPFEYITENEQQCQYLSVKVKFTTDSSSDDFFNVYSIRARLAPESQQPYTYSAFIDATTPSERLGVAVKHTGSEFKLYTVRLMAQRKKHQRKG